MKQGILAGAVVFGLLTACDSTRISDNHHAPVGTPYALVRVGTTPLPVDQGGRTLLADTLWIGPEALRIGPGILHQLTVFRDGGLGQIQRSEANFNYQLVDNVLTYDQCPIGYYCAANLVYMPRVFDVVGDSLFETEHPGTSHYVYGRVR